MGTAAKRHKKGKKNKDMAHRGKTKITAVTADKHDLYQRAVQDPAFEVEFLTRAFRDARPGETPYHFREDFCGTALTAVEWIKQGSEYTADGFDLDPTTLEWGRRHNLLPLGPEAKRIQLFEADVRSSDGTPADVRCAHNFSYQVFKQRAELLEYFQAVHRDLSDRGVFCLDMFGGSEAIEEVEEERWVDDDLFKYVWDQDQFHPGTADITCYIHFKFRDGSQIKRAFTYDWRLWTMPEIKELMHEAGFSRVTSYFEEYDEDGDGTGEFSVNDTGDACESWLAYVVGAK